MLRKINSNLRKLIAVMGALFLILSLMAKLDFNKENDDGFQTKEFDDIW